MHTYVIPTRASKSHQCALTAQKAEYIVGCTKGWSGSGTGCQQRFGWPIPESVQGQVGWGTEQTGLSWWHPCPQQGAWN